MASRQNLKAIDAWQAEHVERITIKPNRAEGLSARIQAAVDAGKAASRQAYIIAAVKAALERDGIPELIDD